MRLCFTYETCWAKERKAKDVIKGSRNKGQRDVLETYDKVRFSLGRLHYKWYKDRECRIKSLLKYIDDIMDMYGNVVDADKLLRAREELADLYNFEEVY